MSQGYFDHDSFKTDLHELFSGLISANHILHYHKILDCFGHISVRNPKDDKTFFMAHNSPPALVSKVEDLIEFRVENGDPADPANKIGWSERYIHSEIYKRYPHVNSVVHSYCADVLPFTVSNVPIRPVTYVAGFLGTDVPVWDVSRAYSSGDSHDLLVRTPRLGASLASSFSKSATAAGMIYNTISSKITGNVPEPAAFPDYPVVLMRGHGFAVAAKGIEEAVYQAIYTQHSAKIQTTALTMESAFGGGAVEGKVDMEGGGKIKGGKLRIAEELHYMTSKETNDTWTTVSQELHRPWTLWMREVERNPLYDNECKEKLQKG